MTLIVLDYETGSIHYIKNVPDDIEDLELFVYSTLGYKDSEISGMLVEDDFLTIRYTYDKLLNKKIYDNENYIDYD